MQAMRHMIANHGVAMPELAEVLAMVNNTRLDATAASLTSAPWRIAKLEGLDATAAGMIGAMHGTGRSSGAIGNRLAGIRPPYPRNEKRLASLLLSRRISQKSGGMRNV
jgi:hypothetical protein